MGILSEYTQYNHLTVNTKSLCLNWQQYINTFSLSVESASIKQTVDIDIKFLTFLFLPECITHLFLIEYNQIILKMIKKALLVYTHPNHAQTHAPHTHTHTHTPTHTRTNTHTHTHNPHHHHHTKQNIKRILRPRSYSMLLNATLLTSGGPYNQYTRGHSQH